MDRGEQREWSCLAASACSLWSDLKSKARSPTACPWLPLQLPGGGQKKKIDGNPEDPWKNAVAIYKYRAMLDSGHGLPAPETMDLPSGNCGQSPICHMNVVDSQRLALRPLLMLTLSFRDPVFHCSRCLGSCLRAAGTKCHTPGWFQQQEFIFSQSWRLQVQNQGVGKFSSS